MKIILRFQKSLLTAQTEYIKKKTFVTKTVKKIPKFILSMKMQKHEQSKYNWGTGWM